MTHQQVMKGLVSYKPINKFYNAKLTIICYLVKEVINMMPKKVHPTKSTGILKISGNKVTIGEESVKSEPGSSSKVLLKRLKDISKKSIFRPPALSLNE